VQFEVVELTVSVHLSRKRKRKLDEGYLLQIFQIVFWSAWRGRDGVAANLADSERVWNGERGFVFTNDVCI